MLLNCGVGEDSWESLGLQGDQTSQSWRISVLNIHWQDWCWSSNTLATWCENWFIGKDPDAGKDWRWEEKGMTEDEIDGWMASPTQWTWVWASSRSWWWTGRPGMLQFMGSQRVGHDWATELNWGAELIITSVLFLPQIHNFSVVTKKHEIRTQIERHY